MTVTVLQISTVGTEQLNDLSKVIQLVSDKQEHKFEHSKSLFVNRIPYHVSVFVMLHLYFCSCYQ